MTESIDYTGLMHEDQPQIYCNVHPVIMFPCVYVYIYDFRTDAGGHQINWSPSKCHCCYSNI